MQFTCTTCGKTHDAAEISFGAEVPDQWLRLSDAERERSSLTSDQCIIRSDADTHFFVRGCLDLPIRGSQEFFSWGVWVSLSEKSFDQMHEHWRDAEREKLGPYFGWLCTRLPFYSDTMFMKTMVHLLPLGVRPQVALEPTQHALAIEQREGLEPSELQRLVTSLLHE